MLIKQYKVQVIEPTVRLHLESCDNPTAWLVSANDLPSAWRKFTRQHFSALCPNPSDYDIRFHSIMETV